MKITREKFSYLSDLVKLNFTQTEEIKLNKDLNQLLEFIDTMNEVSTDDVEPLAYAHQLKNVFREDLATNVPESNNGCYVVPRILE
jgi:aspartyl-tRNA(Asn)/glutamyl-tRNA(Gln) amidotransferase subunit C